VRDTAGRPAADIYGLGPPLRGRWYETTTIREIRGQGAALASILFGGGELAGPRSAAWQGCRAGCVLGWQDSASAG